MHARIAHAFLIAALIMPAAALAQSSDVTFTVPVSLKKMNADITKILVYCEVVSAALGAGTGVQRIPTDRVTKQVEFTPSGGALDTVASVVIPVASLDLSRSKTASYKCTLSGFSQSLQRWDRFNETSTTPAFRLTPTPADLTGMFDW